MVHIYNTHELGETLRAARKRLGLTQPQLAMAAGVGVRFMVDLEAGKPTLRLASVLSVIDALGGTLAIHGLPSSPAPEGNDHGA
jgi:y4mF family transcriptional regulator